MPRKPIKEKESISLTFWGIIVMIALVIIMTVVESVNPPTQARQVICSSQNQANLTAAQKTECANANQQAVVFKYLTLVFVIPLVLAFISVIVLKKKWGIIAYGVGFLYSIIIHIVFHASYSFIVILAELILIGLLIWIWRNKEVT